MKFTLALPGQNLYPGNEKLWFAGITAEEIARISVAADELGFDFLRVGEHIAMHRDWVDTMGSRWLDCLTTLAFVAGITKKIRLSTSVLVPPYHHPVKLAKRISTLDYLSNGRLNLTVAAGYMEWEFKLLGIPFHERGAITDEYLDALQILLTQEEPVFEGKYISFQDIFIDPKSIQKPHPPIWIGGCSKNAIRRAARIGQGWQPWGVSRTYISRMISYLKNQADYLAYPREIDFFSNMFEGKIDPATHKVIEAPQVRLDPDYILNQIQILANIGVTVTDVDALFNWGEYGSLGCEELPSINNCDQYIDRMHWVATNVVLKGKSIH